VKGGRDSTRLRCEQVDDLLSTVVQLKEEVERLRSIRQCKQEVGGVTAGFEKRCWGDTLPNSGGSPALQFSRRGR